MPADLPGVHAVLDRAFTGGRLAEPPTPALVATFRGRAALTRFIVDLGLSLP